MIAVIASFLVMFLTDFVWYVLLFKGFLAERMTPTGSNSTALHAVGELCLAFLLALIYPAGYKGGSSMTEGIKFGLLMGLVYQLPNAIHMHASMGGPVEIVFFFIANGIVVGILGGLAVASVYGKSPAS